MIGVVAGAAGVIVACGCDDGLPHVGSRGDRAFPGFGVLLQGCDG